MKLQPMPICEACKDEPAISFAPGSDPQNPKWEFVGRCRLRGTDFYDIEIDRFFKSPEETVDWMAHMSEKRWFDPADFFKMMWRLRRELCEAQIDVDELNP